MIARLKLTHLPTPVEPLLRLSTQLGVRLSIKRDDLTGPALGGNKARKLEYVLAEALAVGAKTLVTVGAAQSNHCRQTAALAARLGMKCILVLSGDAGNAADGNVLVDQLLGAEIIWTTKERRAETLKAAFDKAWEDGLRPYLIPLGASNGLGSIAYATAFDEMLGQLLEEPPDWIVVASSSGGTQAGLALGAKRSKFGGRVLGISIDHPAGELRETVAFLANEAGSRLKEKNILHPEDIWVCDDYLGSGYGVMSVAERNAIHLFANTEGILLDPVYTGRAAAGLMDLIRKGYFQPNDKILFWHTGGIPALFAEPYASQLC